MKKRFALAALLAAGQPMPSALAAAPTTIAAKADTEIRRIADGFFDLMKAANAKAAYDASLGANPLMAGREAERQALTAQFASGIEIYGPIRHVEQVDEKRLGSMFVRRVHIAQHDKMVTRWQIAFARLPIGWSVVHLALEDKVNDWE